MAGSSIPGTVYAGIVACGTLGAHAGKSSKSSVITKGPGELFKFQNAGLNRFFAVFYYCFKVISLVIG